MAKANQFEDLTVWQKARSLTKEVYHLTRETPLHSDYGLRSQMQRAAVSIMSNIAEGFDRESRREFHQFLTIAKGSCGELRSQLYVSLDIGYVSQPQFDQTIELAQEVFRMIKVLIASLDVKKRRKPPTG